MFTTMIREKFREHLSLITYILMIALVLMFLVFAIQWYLIQLTKIKNFFFLSKLNNLVIVFNFTLMPFLNFP